MTPAGYWDKVCYPSSVAVQHESVATSSTAPIASCSTVPLASSSAVPIARQPARPGLVVWQNDPSYPLTAAYMASHPSSSTSSISSALSLTTTTSASSNSSPSVHDSVCVVPQALPAGSPFNLLHHPKAEPVSPCPKKEEPESHMLVVPHVTPSTCVQLLPMGHAQAATLQLSEPNPTIIGTPQRCEHSLSPSPPSTPLAHASTPSVLATPAPNAAGVITAAPTPPVLPARIRQYSVRRVGIFYSSFLAAHAVARLLGLEQSKIMVSDNVEKLEAWITGKPFVGDNGSL